MSVVALESSSFLAVPLSPALVVIVASKSTNTGGTNTGAFLDFAGCKGCAARGVALRSGSVVVTASSAAALAVSTTAIAMARATFIAPIISGGCNQSSVSYRRPRLNIIIENGSIEGRMIRLKHMLGSIFCKQTIGLVLFCRFHYIIDCFLGELSQE